MIQRFINDICDILNIPIPEVSFDTSNFTTDTTLAQCTADGTVIYLKSFEKLNPDTCFAIAHELRHVWQIRNNYSFYFSDYKPSNLCNGLEEYNLQLAEVDANAFAGVIMIGFFHLRPQFNGLPDTVKIEIYKRMEQIKKTCEKPQAFFI